MTRLVVHGATGRMGVALATLTGEADGIELVGGIARGAVEKPEGYPRIVGPAEADSVIGMSDVVIDVSTPEALSGLVSEHAGALEERALVVGTTGLRPELIERLDALSERCAVLVAANFSVGVTLLEALVEEAARRLGSERYDVEIVEAHHRGKADAPSGTALALGGAVARGRGLDLETVRRDGRSGRPGARPAQEIGFHALRGGGVPGEHRVHFLGDRERIELAHIAADRALFAEGALEAARWIAGKPPGRYTMRQVLGLDDTT